MQEHIRTTLKGFTDDMIRLSEFSLEVADMTDCQLAQGMLADARIQLLRSYNALVDLVEGITTKGP